MSIKNLGIFNFHHHEIRVIKKDMTNEPWFFAKDILGVLENQNTTHIIKILDDDEKYLLRGRELDLTLNVRSGHPGPRRMWIISESGVYQCLMRSDKPIAQDFQRWLRKTVLPGIRKGEIVAKPNIESPIKSLPKTIAKPKKKGDLLPAEKLLHSYEAFKELFNDLGYGDEQLVKSLCLATALLNNPDVKIPGIERLISKILEQGNYAELITALENYLNKNNSKI